MCTSKLIRTGVGLLAVLFTSWAQVASAEQPPGCSGCGLDVQITRSPGIIVSGGIVTYTIRVGNDSPGSCNVTNATVTLYPPGANGLPNLANPIVITTSLSLLFGTPPFVLATTNIVVTTSPGVTIAKAELDITGPKGSCELSAIDQAS